MTIQARPTLSDPETAQSAVDATADAPAIGIHGLSHRYPAGGGQGDRPALDDVSFTVAAGERVAILGPNGGGKTTLFRILATMLAPHPAQPGAARIFGLDVAAEPTAVRRRIGMVFQAPSLDGKLTAAENLRHQGHLYGLRGRDLMDRIDRSLAEVGLADRAGERTERFSGGMRRRIELAKAMLHAPSLLLMDEPATGLDPAGRRDLTDRLERLQARGTTIALTTHLMDEAERCDRVAILDQGRLLALDTPGRLKQRVGGEVVTLEPTPNGERAGEDLAAAIADRFGPFDAEAAPRVIAGQIRFERTGAAELVAELTHAFPGQIQRLTIGQPTLEDVFLHLTGSTLQHDPAS
jgi:ABC-2 type transport system ATP-binding protein